MTLTTAYSNGFDLSRVLSALTGRVGWLSGTAPASGRYFEDFHALVREENVSKTMPLGMTLPAYQTALTRAAITRCLSAVFRVPEFQEQVLLCNRSANYSATPVTNTNQFVGYDINVANAGVSTQVDQAVLSFDTNATFKLYLFKEGYAAPIWEQSVSAVGGEQTIVALPGLVLNYLGSASKGSRFFLGYFQSELGTTKAIREAVDLNRTYCFAAQFCQATATGAKAFNQNLVSYPGEAMGLNLQVSSFKDYTAAIVAKAALFDEAIGLCVAYNVIEQMLYAVRSNATERIIKDDLARAGAELDLKGYLATPDTPQVRGLAQKIDEELTRLRSSFYPKPKAATIHLC